jgi:hypothetical protein
MVAPSPIFEATSRRRPAIPGPVRRAPATPVRDEARLEAANDDGRTPGSTAVALFGGWLLFVGVVQVYAALTPLGMAVLGGVVCVLLGGLVLACVGPEAGLATAGAGATLVALAVAGLWGGPVYLPGLAAYAWGPFLLVLGGTLCLGLGLLRTTELHEAALAARLAPRRPFAPPA